MSVADIFMPSVASLNAGITDPSFMSHGLSRVDRRREQVSQALNVEEVFQQQRPDSQNESPITKNDSLHHSILSH